MNGQPVEPILRLNSGFHIAAIRSIAVDKQGKFLLTVSEDKTSRLWDARQGNLLRILRPPIGLGNEGSLYACALSPDGEVAAIGGCTGASWNKSDSSKVTVGSWTGFARQLKYSVYLFSPITGELLLNIDQLESEIQDLCFSPDGQYLAIALGDNKGIRVVRASDGVEIRRLIGYGGTVRKIAFSKSGQLASVADDRYFRLYNESFQLIATKSLDGKPSSVTFSPDGAVIAVGITEQSIISLFQQTGDNKFQTTTLLTSLNSSTVAVAYSHDGILFSGEQMQNGNNCIIAWKNGKRTEIPSGAGRIADIKVLPDGSVVYATSHPEIGRILNNLQPPTAWEENKEKAYLRTANMIALTQPQPELFQLNDDGSEVGLTVVNNEILYFSLTDRILKTAPSYLPKATNNKMTWSVLEKDEISRCVDISNNGKQILLGTNQHVICLDRQRKVIWKQTIFEGCIAAKIAGNGEVAVVALGDGTYAWYDIAEGIRLLTLFVHPDHKRWILWTPAGFYDCSAGAEELIGWNLNQGKYKASGFYPVAQFRNNFYRPEIIDRSIGSHRMEYVARYDKGDLNAEQNQAILQNLPPEVNIINPLSGSSVNTRQVRLQYMVATPKNSVIQSVKVLVDGRPAQLLPSVKQGINELFVDIPEQDCEISMIARNTFASSVPATVKIKWTGSKEENLLKPKLYVLAIGISKYRDKDLVLRFAAKDASDFANIMSKQKGLLYGDVSVRLLTDEKCSKVNILDGLQWIQNETTSRDVAMIFFAGHGITDNTGTFFYMPVEADRDRLRSTCVNYAEITQSVAAIAGKVVLFMDACHSGSVAGNPTRRSTSPADIIGVLNELGSADNGAVVFASSTGKQYSLEDAAWNNGAFTKALVEGIEGKADLFSQRSITIKSLDLYISQRVKLLTKGQQAPVTIIPVSITDFPIALSR